MMCLSPELRPDPHASWLRTTPGSSPGLMISGSKTGWSDGLRFCVAGDYPAIAPSPRDQSMSPPTMDRQRRWWHPPAGQNVVILRLMSLVSILAALTAAGVGWVVKRFIVRKWRRLALHTNAAVFPAMCPICLSREVATTIEERSESRQTANYVVAQKLEWWTAKVPHCASCTEKQSRNWTLGFVVGGASVLVAFILMPPSAPFINMFVYILFGFPAYVMATTIQKGIVFGPSTSSTILLYIRHQEYASELAALNRAPVA